ncbi:MAG: nucleoside hydrolase [Kiritimatiellae bacterium]|nr:nucleoside hydrolase [Kiritimatiellia bacterium]
MKTRHLLSVAAACAALFSFGAPEKIIFDTDMYTDFDDVGALATLHALADAGECEILGTMACTRGAPSLGMVEIINAFYGRPDIPVGVNRELGIGPLDRPQRSYAIYLDMVKARKDVVKHPSSETAPDANETYRRILAAQPDGSVTICSVGFATNMRRLLETKGDAASPLDGRALVARKVKAWYAMACRYPDGYEYNSKEDGESSKIAFRDWPTPIYFLDWCYGVEVKCGVPVSKLTAEVNPVRDVFKRALREYKEEDKGHAAWDEVTVLAAVRGWQRHFNVVRGKFAIVDEKGKNAWTPDPKGNHYVLTVKTPKAEVGKIVDELMARGPMDWIDGRNLPLEGKPFADVKRFYDRMPASLESNTNVNRGVWGQCHNTAGECFRFTTDATRLRIQWSLVSGRLAMPHMPATGVSGIDVYGWTEGKGWVFVKNGRPLQQDNELAIDWQRGRPIMIYLPLYNGISSFKVGVAKGTKVAPLAPRASGVTKPVVFYGTSITHGGCASRPGMAWVNIAARKADVPAVNLGFSGSGKMELDLAAVVARIDASCYVLDCLWNMKPQMVRERFEPFVRELRRLRPDVPIVCAEDCSTFRDSTEKGAIAKAVVDKLLAEGWKGLSWLPNTEQMTRDTEEAVDGCHPNDWGMAHMGEGFARAIRKALGK